MSWGSLINYIGPKGCIATLASSGQLEQAFKYYYRRRCNSDVSEA